MSHDVRCHECGASMKPGPDGRLHNCPYCGAAQQVAIGGDQLAAGLRLDLANTAAFVADLAAALHGFLGERTTVRHAGGQVVHFEVNLDPDLFVVKHEGRGVTAQYKKLVRGIALKTVTHPLDRWVELLSASLASFANENARVAQVLAGLRPPR
jgi:hypothetical protein